MHYIVVINCAAVASTRNELLYHVISTSTHKSGLKTTQTATIIVLAIALSTDALEDTEIPVSYSVIFP